MTRSAAEPGAAAGGRTGTGAAATGVTGGDAGHKDCVSVIDQHTSDQVAAANASGRVPVVFLHGLWLLSSSWDRWAAMFGDAGYAPVLTGWPGEPQTVAEGNEEPEAFAGRTLGEAASHYAAVIGQLSRRPALVGHSFGGLLAQILAGEGLSAATVVIDAAPFRGVYPLPLSALRAARPVLSNPANVHRAVPLTYDQFRRQFANAVSEPEARQLYDTYTVPASGSPLFDSATANLNPWSQARVDYDNPDRGPMLVVTGDMDATVPPSVSQAVYQQQAKNPLAPTEIAQLPGRGHSLTIDSGWQDVAAAALAFIRRFT